VNQLLKITRSNCPYQRYLQLKNLGLDLINYAHVPHEEQYFDNFKTFTHWRTREHLKEGEFILFLDDTIMFPFLNNIKPFINPSINSQVYEKFAPYCPVILNWINFFYSKGSIRDYICSLK